MKKMKCFFIWMMFSIVLLGCQQNDEAVENIYDHLTATVIIEEDFEIYQEKINELESKEHDLYNKIIALGDDEKAEIKELTDEALHILDEKVSYIQLIKETLNESREEFEKIEPFIDQINDETQFDYVSKMFQSMTKRYSSYDDVYNSYVDSVRLTNELYEGFSSEDFTASDIYTLIGNINDSYESIMEANEKFNQETILYNSLKEDFYHLLNSNE